MVMNPLTRMAEGVVNTKVTGEPVALFPTASVPAKVKTGTPALLTCPPSAGIVPAGEALC